MIIKFKKDLTKNDQDGFSLVYSADNKQVIIQISRTALSSMNVTAYNIADLFEQVRFEPLIECLFGGKNDDQVSLVEVIIDGDGLVLRGKLQMVYALDQVAEKIKNNSSRYVKKCYQNNKPTTF